MNKTNYDYIILGGGCAALSLAINIIKNNINDSSFLIVEKRSHYFDDRSWCFWERNINDYSDLIEKSWKKWNFSKDDEKKTHFTSEYSYHYIRSISFYKKGLNLINHSKNISIRLGENVLNTTVKNDGIIVKTDKSTYKAKSVLDTRPKIEYFSKKPLIFQSFLGYELEIDNLDAFEDVAHIMNDMRIINKNFVFDYILQISKSSVLFETTFFSKEIIPKEFIKKELIRKIKFYNLNYIKILREEYSAIPMGFIKEKKHTSNYFYAGTAGGAIRASSGYGFLRIQEWAIKCSKNIRKNKAFISHPTDKKIFYYMDKIFIDILIKNIDQGPRIFNCFLRKVSSKSFIEFMNNKINIFGLINIILSMPIMLFLKSLIKFNEKN